MQINNKLILENSKNLNILYVEDDELLRNSTAELFSNYFNSVEVAIDGNDGYEKYKLYFDETGQNYDIVISDINMPIMDGLEMCSKVREITFDQSIILVTAFNETSYLHKAIEIGIDGFLTKPIETEQLKSVLYKTTQAVADRKLVKEYYENIEDTNMLNINKILIDNYTSPKNILKDLEENKEDISYQWSNKKTINDRLQKHAIDVEFFRSRYAINVIEYFLAVIREEAEIGNCPVVFVMLDFFKNKNLPLEDIFMICVLFKNTLTSYIFGRYVFNNQLFDDISLILDKNFEGVIVNYLKMKNIKKVNTPEPKRIEKKEIVEDINYAEYVLENDLYELEDLEEEIDSLAILVTGSNTSVEDSTELGNKIQRYGEILCNYPLFSELGKCVVKLGINFINNSQLLIDDKARMLNITALIEGFVNDLIVWRKEIFENNIENPHFLDNSFFSNVDTIIMFIEYDESAEVTDDGDMEFF